MERVSRQESVTELTILEFSIFIFVISFHNQLNVIHLSEDVKQLQTFFDFTSSDPTLSIRVKYSESINQVEVCSQRQVNFDSFQGSFKL